MAGNMERFEQVLKEHMDRYPIMSPQDCAKLIYQSEFAGGHMIADAQRSLEWIEQELAEVSPAEGEIYEDIGSGIYRLHFGPARAAGMGAEEINLLFTASAGLTRGSKEGQEQKLNLLEKLCREGCMAFSAEELSAFLAKYRAEGCPALHHSEEYTKAYEPHYRVVKL